MDPVTVCNLALGRLGQAPILSLDDQDTRAELCARHFPSLLETVLEEREWSFAVEERVLTHDPTAPVSINTSFTERYLIPSDVVRVLQADDGTGDLQWQPEGGYILTPTIGTCTVRVLKKVGVEVASPGFCRALATRLASELATALTKNAALGMRLLEEYEVQLRKAAALDGLQGRSKLLKSNTLKKTRGGGGSATDPAGVMEP